MRSTLQSLKEYQDVLIRIAELERLLSFVPSEIENQKQEWESILERIADLEKRKEDQEEQLKTQHKTLEESTVKAEKFEHDLHQVTNNKEYHAVLKEIDINKKQIHSTTENIAARKSDLEEIGRNMEECKELEKESRTQYETAFSEYKASQKDNQKELKTREKERKKLADQVPQRVLKQFTRIAARRNGVGLSLCLSAVCQSCNVRVRQNVVDELRKFKRVITCEHCKRILYFDDGEV